MGGHGAGDVASRTALDALDALMTDATGPTDLGRIIDEANRRVFEAMRAPSGRPAMGTTVAGLWVVDGGAIVFNVGDSRAYAFESDVLRRISVDHTPLRSLADGRRSHALTQSLGGTSIRLPLQPHVEVVSPRPGDIVVLCTDGLTDMLDETCLVEILSSRSAHPAASLVDAAVQAGGRDNVTVVMVAF